MQNIAVLPTKLAAINYKKIRERTHYSNDIVIL